MSQELESQTFNKVADKLSSTNLFVAVGEVALTALSFGTPPKERLYRKIRAEYNESLKTTVHMQPSISDTLSSCQHIIDDAHSSSTSPALSDVQLTRFVGTMFQFSDRTPFIRAAMTTPYENIAAIYEHTIESARSSGPQSYADNLAFAMTQTDHLPTALWNLFLTSRQFARWRDSEIIVGLPDYTTSEKMDKMRQWYESLAACKEPHQGDYQDVSGDAYYVWTHALARTIYGALPVEQTRLNEFYHTAFTYGSHVMSLSRKLGTLSVFGTMSDHVPAAKYGNAIGQLCADKIIEINTQKD